MLKTTTREARKNIQRYIIEHFNPEGFEYTGSTEDFSAVAAFIRQTFRNEKRYQSGNQQEIFIDWCGGLPSVLDTCYYYNRSAVDDLAAILEQTPEETSRYDESQAEERLTRLIYRELFNGKAVKTL